MKYAHIVNGIVQNAIEGDDPLDPLFAATGTFVPLGNGRIGDSWDGSKFTSPPPPLPTESQYIVAVQQWLDDQAQARGYDGILSAASYAYSSHPKFGPEGIAALHARDNAWQHCYDVFAEVTAGTRPVPSISDLLSELTPIEWPQ